MRSLTLTFLVFVYPLLMSEPRYYCIYLRHLSLLVEWQVHLDENYFWQLRQCCTKKKLFHEMSLIIACKMWYNGCVSISSKRKKTRDRLFVSRERPDRFHRSRRSKPITSRLDLQIRSNISILSALQIDNTREERCAARRRKKKKTFMRPDDPAWLLTFPARTGRNHHWIGAEAERVSLFDCGIVPCNVTFEKSMIKNASPNNFSQ